MWVRTGSGTGSVHLPVRFAFGTRNFRKCEWFLSKTGPQTGPNVCPCLSVAFYSKLIPYLRKRKYRDPPPPAGRRDPGPADEQGQKKQAGRHLPPRVYFSMYMTYLYPNQTGTRAFTYKIPKYNRVQFRVLLISVHITRNPKKQLTFWYARRIRTKNSGTS